MGRKGFKIYFLDSRTQLIWEAPELEERAPALASQSSGDPGSLGAHGTTTSSILQARSSLPKPQAM